MTKQPAQAGSFIPRLGFSLDNAGMVAVTGYYKYLAGQFIGLDAAPLPEPLSSKSV